jgi:uncharacterized LabA/DUF88 family protein
MERVIAYIDGYNLYHGLTEKGSKKYLWLDVPRAVTEILKPDQTLVHTHYFTTVFTRDEERRLRQKCFLEALATLPGISIHYGRYYREKTKCTECGHVHRPLREKMTDVNIAVNMLSDGFSNKFDTALLFSGDSDLCGAIQAVQALPGAKRVIVVFPPDRKTKALMNVAAGYWHLSDDILKKCILPNRVVKHDGYAVHRPEEWT